MSQGPTVVCRCEEVTEPEIRSVIQRGYHSLEEIKRILRCGMGHCQGRSCMMIIARILSRETGGPIRDMKFPGSRPPLKPVPLEVLGGYDPATTPIEHLSSSPSPLSEPPRTPKREKSE